MNVSFEQGPIRPPSEAKSLLIRVTRNCPWNKCAFCRCYRGTKFEIRSIEDVKEDIRCARRIADDIRSLSWKMGEGGSVSRAVVAGIFANEALFNDSYRSIAAWLYFGGESVFLQDANSLVVKTDDLAQVISFIKEAFPSVTRITSYCRSKTAARKSREEFETLRDAGLSRVHIGMETGYDPLLAFIRKGVTAAEHVAGGRNVVEAGISLSEYIMPGLGGERWSREHAVETARVMNEINPDFIRLRSVQAIPGTELYRMMDEGQFIPLSDDDMVREIRLFIENLDGIESTVVSDHILNLLEELEGKLPEDRERLLGIIDRYCDMPEEKRRVYQLGRRRGIYRRLDDLDERRTYDALKDIVDRYRNTEPDAFERDLKAIMYNYI
ncbi:MAG: radical SAM protein [Deltaproteobacteria bacterium]|nr:radical SAM protein [Deltaproteobacteria bacterium]